MMLRSISDADGAGDQEGERERRSAARPSSQAGPAGADSLLHDEGRVGAEHHHLAMRHVDDAHHAEGDGEADGGQQQHRAEAEALEQRSSARPRSCEPLLDRGDGAAASAALELRVGVGRQAEQRRLQLVQRLRRRRAGERRRRVPPASGVAAARRAGWPRAPAAAPPAPRGPSRRRAAAPAQAASPGRGCAKTDCGGGQPLCRIGAEQRQRADGGVERAAQAVVDADRLQRPGWRRRASCRSRRRAAVPSRSLTQQVVVRPRRAGGRRRAPRAPARRAGRRSPRGRGCAVSLSSKPACARAGRAPRRALLRARRAAASTRASRRTIRPEFAWSARLALPAKGVVRRGRQARPPPLRPVPFG